MSFLRKSVVMLCVASMFSGCALVDHQVAKYKLENHAETVDARMTLAMQPAASSRVMDNEGVWVNKRSLSVKEEQLPAVFRAPLSMSFGGRASLKDVTNLISRETGLRFAFAPDVQQEGATGFLNAGFQSEEDLRSLLTRITAQQDMSWKYTDGGVEIFRFDTKVFQVAALPGTTEFTSQVSNKNSAGAGASSSQSSSGQDSRFTMKLEFWKGVRDDLKNLVQSGAYSVSESNGTVTVTGTPQVLASVESYIKNLNAMKMRQVALEVRAYSVELSAGSNFGVSWEAAYARIAQGLNVSAVTPASSISGLGAITAVLSPSADSRFAGSQIVLSALSTMGKTSVAAEASQLVLSGESVPVSSLRKVSYLAEIQTSAVPNAGTQTSLKQGSETEGFAMTITPSIVSGDYVQIAGVIDLSSIDRIVLNGSGGQQVQSPEVSTRSLPIKVGLKSGETYLFGLRQNIANIDDSGLLGTSTLLTPMGGNHGSKETRKTIVVTVTARVVNPQTH
jgi:type IVB pilus formation R64 PilN family outer membrane protein